MTAGESEIIRIEELPSVVPPGARLYLRPLALVGGGLARNLVAASTARSLAGGVLAFTACELMIRSPGRVACVMAQVADLEAWAAGCGPEVRQRLISLLEHISAPRRGPEGQGLDRPLFMGVINVTPDSFSADGLHDGPEAAVAHGRRLAEAGADILDVGGESVRPGAVPIVPDIERARVLPVVEGLAAAREGLGGAVISIDTRRASVMEAALGAGVRMINDVSALTGDPRSLALAAESDAVVVLMHMPAEPAEMNRDPHYDNAPLDVFDYLEARVEACLAAGIARERLLVDPGIGFGKRGRHNLEILRSLTLFHGLGCPIVLGVSRKGLTGELDRARPPQQRLAGSLAAAVMALDQGVQVLRVHDVAETRQAVDVWERLVGLSD